MTIRICVLPLSPLEQPPGDVGRPQSDGHGRAEREDGGLGVPDKETARLPLRSSQIVREGCGVQGCCRLLWPRGSERKKEITKSWELGRLVAPAQ